MVMHLPKITGKNSHAPYKQNVCENGYMGSFILHSREVMFWQDPSLTIVCTKFWVTLRTLSLVTQYPVCIDTGLASACDFFPYNAARDIFKRRHYNLKHNEI